MRVIVLLILLTTQLLSQNSTIGIDNQHKNIGLQERIYKIKADYIITNNQAKNLYLLRANALKDITIFTSKKTIKPNNTALITLEYTTIKKIYKIRLPYEMIVE